MNRYYQFIVSFCILLALSCFATPAYGSSTVTKVDEFFKFGVEEMQRGNYRAAIDDFQKATELKIDFVAAYSNSCLAYLQLQDYQNAVENCTIAIYFAPKNAQAYLNRGLARYRLGDYSSAISDNNQVIALKPNDFRAYYNRGVARANLKDYSGATADYNLALTQIPQTYSLGIADIYNDRGLAYFELTNIQAAMLDFDKAIRFNTKDSRAYFNRGCACVRHGNSRDAVRDFSQVIRLEPSNGQAYVNRGVAYHKLGYEQYAIADLQTAAEYFRHQEQRVAYEKTLKLMESMQQQIASQLELG